MILYGYRLDEKRKFTVDVEDICKCINCDDGFSDDYFVYTTEEDRDFHYKENINIQLNRADTLCSIWVYVNVYHKYLQQDEY